MAINNVSIFDPPVNDRIIVELTLENIGDRQGTFFIQGVTGIVEGDVVAIDNILAANTKFSLFAESDYFDSTVSSEFGGDLGIINLASEASITVRFNTAPITEVGLYDLGLEAGIYDTETGQIIEVQDRLILDNLFEVYNPPEADISNATVVGSEPGTLTGEDLVSTSGSGGTGSAGGI